MTSKAKRFIKKLMAFGYEKNYAVLLQQYAKKSIFSYSHIMYTAQSYLKEVQAIKKNLGKYSYSRYSAISAILLLKREEAIILQSKKLENMKPFTLIKPEAFGKRRKLTDIEKEHKIAAYMVYAPKLKAKFTSFDEMGWIK